MILKTASNSIVAFKIRAQTFSGYTDSRVRPELYSTQLWTHATGPTPRPRVIVTKILQMKYSPHQELKNQTIDMPDLRLETRVKMIDMRNLQIEVKTNRLKSRQLNRQQKMKLNLRFLQQRDQFQDPDLPQGRHSVRLLQEEQLRVLIQETRDKSSQESDPRLHRVISQHRRHRPLPMTGPTIRNCKNNNIISKSWIIRNRSVFMIIKNLNFYNLKFVSFSLNEYILREKKILFK